MSTTLTLKGWGFSAATDMKRYLFLIVLVALMGCVTKRPGGLRPIKAVAEPMLTLETPQLVAPKLTFSSTTILTNCFYVGYATAILEWCPSPPTNVVGYNIYYNVGGTTNFVHSIYNPTNPCGPPITPGSNYLRVYTNSIHVGKVTTYTFTNLLPGLTYSFAVTALNNIGLESDFSDESQYTVPLWKRLTNSFPISLTFLGTNTYQISCQVCPDSLLTLQTTPSLTPANWSIVATNITPNAYGNINYLHTNTNATSFYRAYLQ